MHFHAIFLSMAAFLSTLLGGLVVVKYRDKLGIITAFAAGVLIAVPLLDLLPESLKLATEVRVPIGHVMYAPALGFIFLYILERYFSQFTESAKAIPAKIYVIPKGASLARLNSQLIALWMASP